MEYRVAVCESVPQAVLRVPWEVRQDRLGADLSAGMRQLAIMADRTGLVACGSPTITYQRPLPDGEAAEVDFAVPVEPGATLGPRSGAEVIVTPGTLVARTCHRGGYEGLGAAYTALHEWLYSSGHRPIGPPTEVYLVGPDEVTDPRRLLTEIRIPVAPPVAVTVDVHIPFDRTVALVRETLLADGFVILAELDLRATPADPPGVPETGHVVLDTCHPELLTRALAADPQAGVMLPRAVAIRERAGCVTIEAANPTVLVQATRHDSLQAVADEMCRLLVAVLDRIEKSAADLIGSAGM
ncbi:GyrI-like domain-containing protein [Nocardia sp. BMG111209]|uniref:GyrI-like domain-containing protein n=1 Tax=Nocardia sp. BMG111209 TaxID=1160137 RepID=UPI00039FBA0D|nr:GyrI-like domain-containing protein [Nocardia sp. BMG111209]